MTTRGATPIRPAYAGLTRCRDRRTIHWQDARRNLARRASDPLSLDNGGVSGAVYWAERLLSTLSTCGSPVHSTFALAPTSQQIGWLSEASLVCLL